MKIRPRIAPSLFQRAAKDRQAFNAWVDEYVGKILADECGVGHRVGSRSDLCPRCKAVEDQANG